MRQFFEAERRAALVDHLTTNAGIVSSVELRGLGFGNTAIATLVRRGELERLRPGIFRSALVPRSAAGATRAAFLGCRCAVAVVHASSAYVQGLLADPPDRPHLGAAPAAVGTRRRRKDFDLHVMSDTRAEDLIEVDGIVVTTPLRTCVDLARRANSPAGRRLAATVLRAATLADETLPDAAAERIATQPRVPGNRLARELLGELPGTLLVRSPLEVDFLAFCVEHGLPLPMTNQVVHGIECDGVWYWAKLAVELDTMTYHAGEEPFERDRERDAELIVEGWRVIRITRSRLEREPEVVAAQLRRLLALPPAG